MPHTSKRHSSLSGLRWMSVFPQPNNFFMTLYDHVQHLAFIASPASSLSSPPPLDGFPLGNRPRRRKGFFGTQLSSSFGDAQHGGVRHTSLTQTEESSSASLCDFMMPLFCCSRRSFIIENWKQFFPVGLTVRVSTWWTITFDGASGHSRPTRVVLPDVCSSLD